MMLIISIQTNLTLTNVVFESLQNITWFFIPTNLTLTNVVFEFYIYFKVTYFLADLTLTNVVFESNYSTKSQST